MKKRKIVPLTALALTVISAGIIGLSQLSTMSAHAQSPLQTPQVQTTSSVQMDKEVSDGKESGVETPEVKGVDTDGPGGHQDPPGANVDQQNDGAN